MLYICIEFKAKRNKQRFKFGKMTHRNIRFSKMHGAGNDYIYVNTLLYNISRPSECSIAWSKLHTGIGSDGLILIGKPEKEENDFSMRIFNADGSEALMCGNGSRCVGKYVFERGMTKKTQIRLETLSGVKILDLHVEGEEVRSVTVDMLEPQFENANLCVPTANEWGERALEADGRIFAGTFVSMGNPHFVTFINDIDTIDIARYGRVLERSEAFPQRCNIEFAEIKKNGTVRTRVWERGSGITLACGTGACATAVAAAETGRRPRQSVVRMDGGDLMIEWSAEDNHVYMTGPATFVFDGEIALPYSE